MAQAIGEIIAFGMRIMSIQVNVFDFSFTMWHFFIAGAIISIAWSLFMGLME